VKIAAVPDTGGKCKLVVYAGTDSTAYDLKTGIGAGC
jgi:hypothetical protein